jgi:hypothetical protein
VPVTADDVANAVRLAVETLADAPVDGWERPAGSLTWTCWETAEHIGDTLFYYAAQIGRRPPPESGAVPFAWASKRAEGPAGSLFADRDHGPAGLLQVVDACGALLTSIVRTTPSNARAHHVYGRADPEGFAAMGVVEVLAHTHDIATGFDLPWHPSAVLCEQILARLFPDVTPSADAWQTLLWATGRGELADRPLRTEWRWRSAPARDTAMMDEPW